MVCGQQYVHSTGAMTQPGHCLMRNIVVDFYNQINLLYGAITEFCSPQSCPEMKATDEYVGDFQTSPALAITTC